MSCPFPLEPVCDAVGGATSTLAGGVLSAIAGWIVQGAGWLLTQLGSVISSTTTVDVQASWFTSHFQVMAALAAVVAVPMLVLATMQAVYHQSVGVLARAAFVQLPLAGLLTGVAVQLVQLALTATDALCTVVSEGTSGEISNTLHAISSTLSKQPAPLPTFVLTVGGLLIVGGALVLWVEMLVRAAAIYVAVLFLPLALASLVWPAVSHWCRRLVETLAALVLSKFVVVAVLSLAAGAVTSGDGFTTVLAGGALLLLAAFTPFTLLRLVPMAEVGAALQLEGAHQRVRHAMGRGPETAVAFAMRQAREHGAHRETWAAPDTPGLPGSGMTLDPGVPGGLGGAGGSGSAGGAGSTSGAGSRGSVGPAHDGAGGGGGSAGGAAWVGGGDAAGGAVPLGGMAPEGVEPADDDTPGLLPLGPLPIEWLPPGSRRIPPGTIPAWEGDPTSVIAALEAFNSPPVVEPDGYGGIIPGVQSPLWGGTEPLSRFEPGPKDDWGEGWQPQRRYGADDGGGAGHPSGDDSAGDGPTAGD